MENNIDRMIKLFQVEMKQRYRIPPVLIEKYKDEPCFMVEIDFTCMEVVVPQVKFIEPMCYEMGIELIEGYAYIILHSEVDFGCPRWGTYVEKMKEVQKNLMNNDINNKVDKVIDSILKESGMLRKEFEEVKGIAVDEG